MSARILLVDDLPSHVKLLEAKLAPQNDSKLTLRRTETTR